MSGDGSNGDRFRVMSAYVHTTHVLLAIGTIVAPAAAFTLEPRPVFVMAGAMLAALAVSLVAALLVAAEFAPHHRVVRWLRDRRAREWTRVGVLMAVLLVAALVPASSRPSVAIVVPAAWALTAVSGGAFWTGLVRLLAATVTLALESCVVNGVSGTGWEPLTVVVAALLALGVLGQDSIYTLAIELDDLRTREAERAVITERRRFASDLHDIQGQHLGLIAVEAELVSRLIDRADYSAAARHADRVQDIASEALEEMHRVVHANREVRLDDEIANAVRVLQSAGIAVDRQTMDVSGLDDETDRLLGLTIREGITNILKHTQAQTCSISIRQERRHRRDGIAVILADAGSGEAPIIVTDASAGTGLTTLAERYRRLGGALDFTQDDGGRLTGWLPTTDGNGDNE